MSKASSQKTVEQKQITFKPYLVTAQSIHTALLLLESKEPSILCQTLRALTNFSLQDMANRKRLFDMGAVKYLVPLIDTTEITVKRFALRTLSVLCHLPQSLQQVLSDEWTLKKIIDLLAKSEDLFVQEFTSSLLANATNDALGCRLVATLATGTLFTRLKNSHDPDVQMNCLQVLETLTRCDSNIPWLLASSPRDEDIAQRLQDRLCQSNSYIIYLRQALSNIIDNPENSLQVTMHPLFSWPLLLTSMFSKYLAIQSVALRVVDQMVTLLKNSEQTFRESSFVLNHLFDILESYEFRDVHSTALNILQTYIESESGSAQIHASGCVTRLVTYLDVTIPSIKPQCLVILSKMSLTATGKQALFDTNTDLTFCEYLMQSDVSLYADAALGVANMTKLMPSAIRMAETNVIQSLGGIIVDERASWFDARVNALMAMGELCEIMPKAAFAAVEPEVFEKMRGVNRDVAVRCSPLQAQKLAMQCFINLLNFRVSRMAMTNQVFIGELLDIMQRPDLALKALTCKLLIGLMVDEEAKYAFFSSQGEKVVHENLRIEHTGLRTAVCDLIAASVTDNGADEYLYHGTINYMIENKHARYSVSNWDPALEAIFLHHPSAKLAYCGRLDLNDFTAEGFYVMKRMGNYLTPMRELLTSPLQNLQPALIAMFYSSKLVDHDCYSSCDIREPNESTESTIQMRATSSVRVPLGRDDMNLRTYLLQLKLLFGDPAQSLEYFKMGSVYEIRVREKCSEVTSSLKQRAVILAEFVSDQMNGESQERDCSLPSVELHLLDLALELGTPVIGLGLVKCGGVLERAVLYKVLADRLGIPCSMHRSSSAHAWCEVAVPDVCPDVERETPQSYPAGLLRTNYVVDLMAFPGRLVRHGTLEAQRVRGPPYMPKYLAREPSIVCKNEFLRSAT